MDPSKFNRIAIVGPPGGGKSTLSKRLSKRCDLPVFHIDRLFFVEDWVERDTQSFLADLQSIVHQEKWITDGNAMRWLPLRLQRAELLIAVTPGRWRCLWGILWRRWHPSSRHRQSRPNGCQEVLRLRLLGYLWTWEKRYLPMIEEELAKNSRVAYIRISSAAQLRQFEESYLESRTIT